MFHFAESATFHNITSSLTRELATASSDTATSRVARRVAATSLRMMCRLITILDRYDRNWVVPLSVRTGRNATQMSARPRAGKHSYLSWALNAAVGHVVRCSGTDESRQRVSFRSVPVEDSQTSGARCPARSGASRRSLVWEDSVRTAQSALCWRLWLRAGSDGKLSCRK